jgi:hypothetical protein
LILSLAKGLIVKSTQKIFTPASTKFGKISGATPQYENKRARRYFSLAKTFVIEILNAKPENH